MKRAGLDQKIFEKGCSRIIIKIIKSLVSR